MDECSRSYTGVPIGVQLNGFLGLEQTKARVSQRSTIHDYHYEERKVNNIDSLLNGFDGLIVVNCYRRSVCVSST